MNCSSISSHHWLLFLLGCFFSTIMLSTTGVDCTLNAILRQQVTNNLEFVPPKPTSTSDAEPKDNQISHSSESAVQATQLNDNPIETNSFKLDESINNIGAAIAKPGQIFKEVQGFISRFIAPAKTYTDLINRYHKWYSAYKSISASINHPIMDPFDAFKLAYARVDRKLLEKEVEKAKMSTAVGHKIEETENLDFVFRILNLIIDHLESDLKTLEENEGVVAEVNLHPEAALENEDAIKEAMARVERSFANQAKSMIQNETTVIIKKAAYTGLAIFMQAKPDTGDFIDHLRPIVSILACASTPLAVSYFQDVQFRAALAIVTHSLEAIVPISKIAEELEKRIHHE